MLVLHDYVCYLTHHKTGGRMQSKINQIREILSELEKQVKQNSNSDAEISLDKMIDEIIKKHPNPSSQRFAMGVKLFSETCQLSEKQTSSVKNTYLAMTNN